MKNTKVSWMDAEELAKVILGMDENADSSAIEDKLYEEYEISFDSFHRIIEDLIPLTVPAKTALMGKTVKGFIKDDCFIVKCEIEE